MSRAMWLALSSSLVPIGAASAACDSVAETEPVDTARDAGKPETTWLDAASGELLCDRPGPPEPGSMLCGAETCDRVTSYCEIKVTTTFYETNPDERSTSTKMACVQRDSGNIPAECQSCQTCGCITPLRSFRWPSANRPSLCKEGGDGDLTLFEYEFNIIGPCYGAPPKGYERLNASS